MPTRSLSSAKRLALSAPFIMTAVLSASACSQPETKKFSSVSSNVASIVAADDVTENVRP